MQSSYCWILIFPKNHLTLQRKLNQFKSVIIKVYAHIHTHTRTYILSLSALMRRVLKTNSTRRAVHYAINVDHFILRLLTAHRTDMTCESGTSQVQDSQTNTHIQICLQQKKITTACRGASKIKSLMKKKYFVHNKHGACVYAVLIPHCAGEHGDQAYIHTYNAPHFSFSSQDIIIEPFAVET